MEGSQAATSILTPISTQTTLGRTFSSQEWQPSSSQTACLFSAFWQTLCRWPEVQMEWPAVEWLEKGWHRWWLEKQDNGQELMEMDCQGVSWVCQQEWGDTREETDGWEEAQMWRTTNDLWGCSQVRPPWVWFCGPQQSWSNKPHWAETPAT